MGHPIEHVKTILLIEDEAIIRMATAAMLEDAGYQVLEEQGAEAALGVLGAHPEIDIVITDVQMPGKIDGLGLTRIIAHAYPWIQTIVTSGLTSIAQARECGATKFLPKPYTASALQSVVQSVLPQRESNPG